MWRRSLCELWWFSTFLRTVSGKRSSSILTLAPICLDAWNKTWRNLKLTNGHLMKMHKYWQAIVRWIRHKVEPILAFPGNGGTFVTQLKQNIVARPPERWIRSGVFPKNQSQRRRRRSGLSMATWSLRRTTLFATALGLSLESRRVGGQCPQRSGWHPMVGLFSQISIHQEEKPKIGSLQGHLPGNTSDLDSWRWIATPTQKFSPSIATTQMDETAPEDGKRKNDDEAPKPNKWAKAHGKGAAAAHKVVGGQSGPGGGTLLDAAGRGVASCCLHACPAKSR